MGVAGWTEMRFFAVLTAHFAAALTIYDNSGQLQTDGYPTSFSKTESWKFRTSGAQTYYLRFDDIHIDPECRSWISVYNDRTIGLPVWSLCDSDTGKTYQVDTDRITVTVNKAYSASGDGKRGVQFSYSVNEGFDQTTTTQSSTIESSSSQSSSTISTTRTTSTRPPISPGGTNAAGYPTPPPYPEHGSANFPLDDSSDESECGNVFATAEISDFDYVAHDLYVRGVNKDQNFGGEYVVSGEEVVPHSYPWQVGIGTRAGAYCGGTIVTDRFVVTAAHCGVLVFIGTYSS